MTVVQCFVPYRDVFGVRSVAGSICIVFNLVCGLVLVARGQSEGGEGHQPTVRIRRLSPLE